MHLASSHPIPTCIYLLSLHDALPIFADRLRGRAEVLPGPLGGGVLDTRLVEQAGIEPQTDRVEVFGDGVLLSVHHVERIHRDRKSTRLNSSHVAISYAVFCLKKKIKT